MRGLPLLEDAKSLITRERSSVIRASRDTEGVSGELVVVVLVMVAPLDETSDEDDVVVMTGGVTVTLPPPLLPPPEGCVTAMACWFSTVTVTFSEEPMFPAASYAFAMRVWVPFDAVPVFQLQV